VYLQVPTRTDFNFKSCNVAVKWIQTSKAGYNIPIPA
jgi:hypothetical protein